MELLLWYRGLDFEPARANAQEILSLSCLPFHTAAYGYRTDAIIQGSSALVNLIHYQTRANRGKQLPDLQPQHTGFGSYSQPPRIVFWADDWRAADLPGAPATKVCPRCCVTTLKLYCSVSARRQSVSFLQSDIKLNAIGKCMAVP